MFYSFVAALCSSVNGAFVTRPNNVAELTNNAVVLTCTTYSLGISWYYIPTGSSSLTPITGQCQVNNEYRSVYHTERPTAGVCNLMVNSTQLMNAGTYLCQDLSTAKYSTAQLVVLGNSFAVHY